MKLKTIEKWEKIVLVISIGVLILAAILELSVKCWTNSFPTIISIATGLAAGFIATIIVLYFERKHEQNKLKEYFIKYQGYYNPDNNRRWEIWTKTNEIFFE